MSKTELKPCPFCGGGDISIDTAVMGTTAHGYGITCLTEGCMGDIYSHNSEYMTKEAAAWAWNRRSLPVPSSPGEGV